MTNSTVSTSEVAPSQTRQEIINEAARIEESLLYSSKGHFAASEFWSRFHMYLGLPMIVLSTLSGASAFVQFDSHHIVAGWLSLVVAVLSAIMTFLNPNKKVAAHFSSGNAYDALMNKVRIFRVTDCWGRESDHVLTERLKSYSERKSHLNGTSPQIPRWAYKRAKKGIQDGEAAFGVDSE